MTTYSLKIPSSIGVLNPIEFIENKLWVVPSNENINPIESDFSAKYIMFLFNEIQDYKEIEILVKEWFNFFGFLLPIPFNFSYLSLNRHIYKDCYENPNKLTIKSLLKNIQTPKNDEIPYYKIINNKITVNFNILFNVNQLNVVELYKKYQKLNAKDELRSNVEFLSISKNLMAHASYFHDNVFYKTAHYFFLFESIINRKIKNKKVEKLCNNCDRIIKLNQSLADKVKEFFKEKCYEEENINFLVKLINSYGKDRSKIVHWGKKETLLEASNNLFKRAGNNFTNLNDEIKNNGVSVSSDIYFSDLCQFLIIEEFDLK